MKKRLFFFGGVVILTLLLVLPFIGTRGESFYYNVRVRALNQLLALANYSSSKDLNVATSAQIGRGITYPYDQNCPVICTSELKYEAEYYQKVLRYKILECDEWWGIVELEYGIIGKYFLMITRDGEIIRFDQPFLPEQKRAKYPPKYDIGNRVYPASLDQPDASGSDAYN